MEAYLKETQLKKPKRGKNRKSLEKKLDELWSKAVLLRDGKKCKVCGVASGLSPHHIVTRKNLMLRWELYNGVTLCVKHHTGDSRESAHGNPEWFHFWLEDTIWEQQAQVACNMSKIAKWSIEDLEQKISDLKDYINLLNN